MMFVLSVIYAPWAFISRDGAYAACHAWCKVVMWSARVFVGLRTEIRGTPPMDEALIAAKHQSLLDIIMIYSAVPRGKFIMKDILKYAPLFGQYSLRLGCIPVKRGQRSKAIRRMMMAIKSGKMQPGQLIIYPQGTRAMPFVKYPYKIGTGVLYRELNQPCVPVACNVGLFWGRSGIVRRPGIAVVEFLPRIEPGKPIDDFMETLEMVIEEKSDYLMHNAHFD